MKSTFCLILFISLCLLAQAQYPCGVKHSTSEVEAMSAFLLEQQGNTRGHQNPDTIYSVPIKFHIVRHDDGNGGLSENKIPQILDTINAFYKNSFLQFEQCGATNYINNSAFMGFQPEKEEEALTAKTEKPRVINMYFMDSVFLQDVLVCGFAYLPVGDDPKRAYITNACALSGNTVPHEIGHLFSLLHTHGVSNDGTDELVNGSNCTNAGDNLCDTPADPNLAGKVVYNVFPNTCSYVGDEKDANGEEYMPNVYNIMSYTIGQCTREFSPQQYNQVYNSFFFHKRVDLFCSPEEITFTENKFTTAFPNPFTHEINVEYELTGEWPVSINLYDLMGKLIAQLYAGVQEEGLVKQRFPMGSTYLQEGFYILKLEVNNGEETYYQKLFRTN